MLDELKDHFILCGFGRMGEIIAREFSRQHVAFVVIERSSDRMQAALEKGFLAVEADASSEDVGIDPHAETLTVAELKRLRQARQAPS